MDTQYVQLDNYFYQRKTSTSSLAFVAAMEEDPGFGSKRRQVESTLASLAADTQGVWAGRVKHVDVASYFQKTVTVNGVEKRYLQHIEPTTGHLVYRDRDHMFEDGSMRLKTVMRREVFADVWSNQMTTDFCDEYETSTLAPSNAPTDAPTA
jgi:hypothetical protein